MTFCYSCRSFKICPKVIRLPSTPDFRSFLPNSVELSKISRMSPEFQCFSFKSLQNLPNFKIGYRVRVIFKHLKLKHNRLRNDCNQCEYKYTQKDSLSAHMQRVHEGVRNNCTHCEYKSGYKSNLNMHIHALHKELMYICNL